MTIMRARLSIASIAIAVLLGAGQSSAQTLERVRQRDQLLCGSSTGLMGFSLPDAHGDWTGLDVDYCRAIAAAVLGDARKVKFVPLDAASRFEALKSALELNGASICVQQGTTTELNLADYFRTNKMRYEGIAFRSGDEEVSAYEAGRCDAYTTDQSSLAAQRQKLNDPDDHVILPETISKEPLASLVSKGDSEWGTILRWVHYAMVDAEENGVTSRAKANTKVGSQQPGPRPIRCGSCWQMVSDRQRSRGGSGSAARRFTTSG
jgi:general L-amino acid transport system substrate-binding protein